MIQLMIIYTTNNNTTRDYITYDNKTYTIIQHMKMYNAWLYNIYMIMKGNKIMQHMIMQHAYDNITYTTRMALYDNWTFDVI